jgi:hypothetical protein
MIFREREMVIDGKREPKWDAGFILRFFSQFQLLFFSNFVK